MRIRRLREKRDKFPGQTRAEGSLAKGTAVKDLPMSELICGRLHTGFEEGKNPGENTGVFSCALVLYHTIWYNDSIVPA